MLQMREELLSHMSAQFMSLQEIVEALRWELLASKAKVDVLPSAVDAKIRKEFHEGHFQSALDDLQEQVVQLRKSIENNHREGQESHASIGSSGGSDKATTALPTLQTLHRRVEDLGLDLEEEHEERCRRDKGLNVRLSREVAELSRCLEEQRSAFAGEMVEAIRASGNFEENSSGANAQAPHEMHAILKVVQHWASDSTPSEGLSAFPQEQPRGSTCPAKSLEPRPEEGGDIHRLYEMGWEDFRDADDVSEAVVVTEQTVKSAHSSSGKGRRVKTQTGIP